MTDFKKAVAEGIPAEIPAAKPYDQTVNHAPRRKKILTPAEERLALKNALRYFPPQQHAALAPEFLDELRTYGRIYMYRYRPDYEMYARPIEMYPARSRQAAAIMLMIQNNLDRRVA
ncbi:MAG: urocanate hydratase, partial [Muribaculaceae bacterium]|nr:urocanate hydratase [Muribaculaceae bacterium]